MGDSGSNLLFEIGVEELPAVFVTKALVDLERLAREEFAGARLDFATLRTLGTPRRIVLQICGLAGRQDDLSERVVGPPARVAFDADGKPTKAAEGFARKNGVELASLERSEVEGRKGEYVVCTREIAGKPASEVASQLLAALAKSIPWPKSMRWGTGIYSFARPVHWIVALLDDAVLPVNLFGIEASAESRGHRFMAPASLLVSSEPEAYEMALRDAFVVVDPARRREMIQKELVRVEGETGATVRSDDELLDEVVQLSEYPTAVCGQFDPAYLEVPEEVVVLAMRSHQRYFAMSSPSTEPGKQGPLCNRFVTIAGTVTRDPAVVRAGNERVLAARLADARFFFDEDSKIPLEQWTGKLVEVMFQAKLGSVADKVGRIETISAHIAKALDVDTTSVARAAKLCKADLLSHMVYEFPELQGVMGMHYARNAGEPEAVAKAIAEHYMPLGGGGELPSGAVGAVVGLADRIDSIVGCFAVGLAPTGSADPYGLRRAAIAILSILRDRRWSVALDDLVEWARVALTSGGIEVPEELPATVLAFFRTRLRGLLVDASLPADCVDAALTAGARDVPGLVARAEAVAQLRSRPDFEPLAVAFKRVANIIKGEAHSGEPDTGRFSDTAERELWSAFVAIRARVEASLGDGDFQTSLQVLAELKDPVDKFFDSVLVMDEDSAVRANRLALLGSINATFTRIADFRQLTV